MNKPKMILFDYGQTLMNESQFDGIAGTQAVLDSCVDNPNKVSAQEIQLFADELNKDIGRYNPETRDSVFIEIHQHHFQNYIYEYFGMKRIVPAIELETIFWNHAAPAEPTENIQLLLEYLQSQRIRTGVISNISFSGDALAHRINEFFPNHGFEFILATSEYVFRKPHKRIFELALKKAGLPANEVWYCGDNLVCDVDGAYLSGITPIWYRGAIHMNQAEPKQDCLNIANWKQLIDVLDNNKL